MITLIMHKYASDLAGKDAATAGALSLAGAGVGVGIGRIFAHPKTIAVPVESSKLPGYKVRVLPKDMPALKHFDKIRTRILEKDPTHIDLVDARKKYDADVNAKLLALKKDADAYLNNTVIGDAIHKRLENERIMQELADAGHTDSKEFLERKANAATLNKAVEDANHVWETINDKYNNYKRSSMRGRAVLNSQLAENDKAITEALSRKINDKAIAWADYHNNLIDAANQKLVDKEAARVAAVNEQAYKAAKRVGGIRGGIAAGLLLPSAYLAYRKLGD